MSVYHEERVVECSRRGRRVALPRDCVQH
jgi:hypothetical protein